ncbi:hypothetical protein [Acanthopleuribacter pedis]|uniref:Ig-like domain-containing protein n=1 Tax=Acanthopleuribacter pedis TaxID=442870 RepID=A0A8J7QN77_9BACT|nr:hypothetical protein [Acanthopleuribacter pedis]MBO1321100.1 hypothetical protein [Acanthopleuribacter pedis]
MLKNIWFGVACLVIATLQAQVPLFEEIASFSRQHYSGWTTNDHLLVGELPCEGLVFYDTTDVTTLDVVGEFPINERSVVTLFWGDAMVFLSESHLSVIDASTPAQPRLARKQALPEGFVPYQMRLAGNQVIVGGVHRDNLVPPALLVLFRLDLSDGRAQFEPLHLPEPFPRFTDHWLFNEQALYVVVSGEMWRYDLDPAGMPENRRTHLMEGMYDPHAPVFYNGGVLVNSQDGLYFVDGTDLSASRRLTFFSYPTHSLTVHGDRAILLDQWQIHLIDLSNFNNVTFEPQYGYVAQSIHAHYDGNRDLLLTANQDRVNLVSPLLEGTLAHREVVLRDFISNFEGFARRDDLIAATASRRLVLARPEGKGALSVLAEIAIPFYDAHLELVGDILYVQNASGFSDRLRLYRVTDPTDPVFLGEFSNHDFAVDGNRLVFLNDGPSPTITVQDASDPANLQTIGVIRLPKYETYERRYYRGLLLQEDLVVVGNASWILVYQFQEGAYRFVSEFEVSAFASVEQLEKQNDHLIVGLYSSLALYDISDPGTPRPLDRVDPQQVTTSRRPLAGVADSFVYYHQLNEMLVYRISDQNRFEAVPLVGSKGYSGFRLVDGRLLAGLNCPNRLAVLEASLCQPPQLTAVPTGPRFLCDRMITDLIVEAEGQNLNYQWYADGEPVSNGAFARLTVEVTEQDVMYHCEVRGDCGVQVTEPVMVAPTVCDLVQGYALWQSDGRFCDTRNPSVLRFVAAMNNGGDCQL